ncbi:MAG: helix-turn-helix domain-containing protein [Treponemataceae bacterium]|nr:helix-turn-helix domain-containing protein [Treponemataceae bacterium]
MKSTPYAITEWPEKTLLSRQETAQILGIGLSTLDSLIPYSELPRTVIHKRVFVHRKELEKYISSCTRTTPQIRGNKKLEEEDA